ncbi:uncharacterized protein PHALS_13055 [Plasmopara halstedii]|uniref:Uncharacterized protein n=1 Tax=Plasmopara halstedii TaxID=4781 RepID=A0A0P1AN31_PLAHL|nr:uncharacterized protein PHALS_13055 [Plasmopara halstedii]CEG42810.1 hypothetical protein PHALS_13055 [Plasmopara halstedii]|eukprot:XP_024579179.1 hypothetical protein PHALS_13055 [Plasmopara halstedii]
MEVSKYEAKRQRRIELNLKKLQELDVVKLPKHSHRATYTKKVVKHSYPVRRSLRQRQQKEDESIVPDTEFEAKTALKLPLTRLKIMKTDIHKGLDLPRTQLLDSIKDKKAYLSSSQIDIELKEFHTQWLGTQLLPVGKTTVMQSLCRPEYIVKFSKMSGIQPWKNAIVLFVNVESNSPYDNVFNHDTRDGHIVVHFQWFGQNRWHKDSPLVKRLRSTKRGDENLKFDDTYDDKVEMKQEPLLLFIRLEQGPYIYCGQLGYLGHRPESKPLEFRWQLLDVDVSLWNKIGDLML